MAPVHEGPSLCFMPRRGSLMEHKVAKELQQVPVTRLAPVAVLHETHTNGTCQCCEG